MKLTIGQTSKAVGLSKTSICKHIENGRLSADWNNETNPHQREIDASEILRVYGVDVTIPPSRRPTDDTKKHSPDTPFDMVVKAKDETIAALKSEIERLSEQVVVKDEQIKASTRLLEAQKTHLSISLWQCCRTMLKHCCTPSGMRKTCETKFQDLRYCVISRV